MKETIDQLSKRAGELNNTVTQYRTAMDVMEKIDIPIKEEAVDALRQKEKEISKQLYAIRDAISTLQKVCTHVTPEGHSAFRYAYSDSHYTYEICDICGTEIKT